MSLYISCQVVQLTKMIPETQECYQWFPEGGRESGARKLPKMCEILTLDRIFRLSLILQQAFDHLRGTDVTSTMPK